MYGSDDVLRCNHDIITKKHDVIISQNEFVTIRKSVILG